jgi:hypothetical protein
MLEIANIKIFKINSPSLSRVQQLFLEILKMTKACIMHNQSSLCQLIETNISRETFAIIRQSSATAVTVGQKHITVNL